MRIKLKYSICAHAAAPHRLWKERPGQAFSDSCFCGWLHERSYRDFSDSYVLLLAVRAQMPRIFCQLLLVAGCKGAATANFLSAVSDAGFKYAATANFLTPFLLELSLRAQLSQIF